MGRLKDNFEDLEMIGSRVMRSIHWARTTAVRRVLLVIGSSVVMVGLYLLLINHLSSYQLERSDYRAKAASQDYDAIQYAELLDLIDECLAPRNAALAGFACRAADLKYSEVQRGSAVVNRKEFWREVTTLGCGLTSGRRSDCWIFSALVAFLQPCVRICTR